MNDFGVFTATDTVRLERLLPGPIERVWAYLTESDKRATWLAAGDIELSIGGSVEHIFNLSTLTRPDDPPPAKYADMNREMRMHGSVVACDPPRLLSYTWADPDGTASEVRFELTPQTGKVKLVVTHSRLSTRDAILGVSAGWHTHLALLADRLEGRASAPYWDTHMQLEHEYERRLDAAAG